MREAVDAMLAGVSVAELRQLDDATKQMAEHVKQINATLDRNAAEHKKFVREIERIRKASE